MSFPRCKRTWNRFQPTSLQNALEGCMEYARVVHNKSVDRIADQMGLPNKWVLYKWLNNGRLPTILIRSFENVCGISLVTKYIAFSGHKLLIDIPSGKKATAKDINGLQASLTKTVTELLKFYDGQSQVEETLAIIQQSLENLAWQKGEVEKHHQPELDLEGVES